jgi:hypothetical protein
MRDAGRLGDLGGGSAVVAALAEHLDARADDGFTPLFGGRELTGRRRHGVHEG